MRMNLCAGFLFFFNYWCVTEVRHNAEKHSLFETWNLLQYSFLTTDLWTFLQLCTASFSTNHILRRKLAKSNKERLRHNLIKYAWNTAQDFLFSVVNSERKYCRVFCTIFHETATNNRNICQRNTFAPNGSERARLDYVLIDLFGIFFRLQICRGVMLTPRTSWGVNMAPRQD